MKSLILFHEFKFTAHAPKYKQMRMKFQPLYFSMLLTFRIKMNKCLNFNCFVIQVKQKNGALGMFRMFNHNDQLSFCFGFPHL